MTIMGAVFLAVLVTLTIACVLWWLRTFLSTAVVRGILTALVIAGWLAFGYLSFQMV